MASKFLSPPALNTDKYNTWKKEMQVWELATTLENHRRAPIVLLSVLELDIATLNADDGIEKLYQKLDTLFLEDANKVAFMAYKSFEKYQRQNDTPFEDFLINFNCHMAKLKEHNILLPEPVQAYRVLKSANLSSQNECLI